MTIPPGDGPPPSKSAKMSEGPPGGDDSDPFKGLNLPPDLSLDEMEAVKKRLKFGSAKDRNFCAPISNPSGNLDLRCESTLITIAMHN